jgi:hypothetical protein
MKIIISFCDKLLFVYTKYAFLLIAFSDLTMTAFTFKTLPKKEKNSVNKRRYGDALLDGGLILFSSICIYAISKLCKTGGTFLVTHNRPTRDGN